MATSQELLDQVNAAIARILAAGQSRSLAERRLDEAQLKELRELRRDLMTETDQGNWGVIQVDRPS